MSAAVDDADSEVCETCGEPAEQLETVESDTPVSAELCETCAPMYRSLFAAQEQERCISCGAEEGVYYVEMEVDSWPYHMSGDLCPDCMNGCYPFVFLEQFEERAENVDARE